MKIANPIYDIVFKFMMEDNRVAKLIIGGIIDKEIVELIPSPQEHTIFKKQNITIYRLDYSAKIKLENGKTELVIIEIQKAKLSTDIMRFRNYLGKEYQKPENYTKINGIKKALPIINIYFLGHKLEHITAPIVKVNRHYTDGITGQELKEKEYFIESLSHDSFVIQIPYLTKKRRTELEKLLSVFDQSNRTKDFHILNVKEDEFPEKYRSVIRKLQQAQESDEVRDYMDLEDQILEDMQEDYRVRIELEKEVEENKKALKDKDKALEDKDKALKDKDKALEENKKALENKDKQMIQVLLDSGKQREEILKFLNITDEKFKNILGNK